MSTSGQWGKWAVPGENESRSFRAASTTPNETSKGGENGQMPHHSHPSGKGHSQTLYGWLGRGNQWPDFRHRDVPPRVRVLRLFHFVVLSVEHAVEVNFLGGAQALADAKWVDLDTLYRTLTLPGTRTRRLVEQFDEMAG